MCTLIQLTEVEKPKWRTSDIFHALFGPHGPTMNNKSDADKTALINTSRRAMQAINVAIRYLLAADCPSTSRAFFPDQAPSLPIGGGVLLRRKQPSLSFLFLHGTQVPLNRWIHHPLKIGQHDQLHPASGQSVPGDGHDLCNVFGSPSTGQSSQHARRPLL